MSQHTHARIHHLTYLALSVALALVLSYVEVLLPIQIAVPGIKIGLANLIVIYLLYRSGLRDAIIVSVIRITLANLLFGSLMGLAFSAAGTFFSLLVMTLFRRIRKFTEIGVSVGGGIAHNLGQIGIACLITENTFMIGYLPVLLISGTLSGAVIGIVGALLIRKIPGSSQPKGENSTNGSTQHQ